ncbi:MAG: hypothetical protein CO013_02680 [Syntrophobacterales bacterium CG_4_8_14_3_um_filter_58_8]|nr:MAG: hypothetical protein COS57_06745 [Syntrophobacterales bacterium CG03_land_8_20_14_0_80_58_14]PJC75177.1 MAG: hypothetical protein CO013_02680 [Syntrophobacterales bacterium CG_4_8_14_3_um_filter_58_8]
MSREIFLRRCLSYASSTPSDSQRDKGISCRFFLTRERQRFSANDLSPGNPYIEPILAVGRDHFSDNPLRGGLRLSLGQGRRSPEIFRREDDILRRRQGKALMFGCPKFYDAAAVGVAIPPTIREAA